MAGRAGMTPRGAGVPVSGQFARAAVVVVDGGGAVVVDELDEEEHPARTAAAATTVSAVALNLGKRGFIGSSACGDQLS